MQIETYRSKVTNQQQQAYGDSSRNERVNRFSSHKDFAYSDNQAFSGTSSNQGAHGKHTRSSSRTRFIRKIVKRKSQSPFQNQPGGTMQPQIEYEITTTKFNKDGTRKEVKKETLKEKPNAMTDVLNTMELLEQIKKSSQAEYGIDSEVPSQVAPSQPSQKIMSNATSSHRRLKTHLTSSLRPVKKEDDGVLSQLFNPSNLASIQTIDLNQQKSNVYINTLDSQQPRREGSSSSRRKYIIIKKKRHRDGSVES